MSRMPAAVIAREGAAEKMDAQADLNALVKSLAERYEKRGERISAALNPLPLLPLKPLATQRMVTNLVENALRYGKGPVEIETHREGDCAVLSVLDRGPGIAPADAEKVLQPFTRLNDARSDTGGAGLGLAIVDRVARMHGGRVRLSTREGGGLEARVELPLRQPPLEEAA